VRLADLLRSGNPETPARACPNRRRRQTAVIYETRQLGSVNEAIQEVMQGKARARLVLAP